MTLREFSEKVETICRENGSWAGEVYDDGKIRIVGCEETEGHKCQVNLINRETKKFKCVATRVNRYNLTRTMFNHYIKAIEG